MLRRILGEEINPGMPLRGALRDELGTVVVPAGTVLTDGQLQRLGKRLFSGLYVGDDWPMITGPVVATGMQEPLIQTPGGTAQSKTVSVESLRNGMRLTHHAYDQNGVLLLASGSRITPRFLRLLRQRDVHRVWLVPPGITASSLIVNDQRPEAAVAPPPGVVLRRDLKLSQLIEEGRRGLEKHAAASGLVGEVCETLKTGKSVSGDRMTSTVREFFELLTLDADLLGTVVGMQRSLGEYLFDHCVNVSLLSMSIAAQRECTQEQIMTIGLGALLHDIGMTRVPKDLRLAPRALTPVEHGEVERHPAYTLEMIGRISGLPQEVGTIGFQTHERLDGSGYPRGRTATTIHPFSRIVAVADCFCAHSRPRPHRPAMLPHDAVKHVLQEGAAGRLDRSVLRSLLDANSAFPIGTLVELSDGNRARVVRANPGAHTRPIVAPLNASAAIENGTINLAEQTDLSVRRAFYFATDLPSGLAERPA